MEEWRHFSWQSTNLSISTGFLPKNSLKDRHGHVSCRQNSIAAKWNIFSSFGLKVPFGFPCFAHVCLENLLGLVFSQRLTVRDFSCRAPFWRPSTFACVPGKFFQSVFVAPLQHGHSSRWERSHVSTNGWTVFLILPPTRDCIFFPVKAHAANSRSAASSLVRMDRY